MNAHLTTESINDSLKCHGAKLPFSENPLPEELQAYLNAVAAYVKEKAEASIKEAEADGSTVGLTAEVTDALVAELFSVTPTPSLAALGNYLIAHPTAIATAVAAGMGTTPHPIAIGSFGLTTVIMSSLAVASTHVIEASSK